MASESVQAQTVTIIGLGRVGTSIGLALKQSSLDITVIGHDRDSALAQEAKEKRGALDKVEWNLINAVAKADILVLNVPVVELEETLRLIGGELKPHTLVLDLASLKGSGIKWAGKYLRRGHYVGVRPVLAVNVLADGRLELESARADLFRNSVFCLMPSATADPSAVETAVNFGLILGATPYFVDPLEYDALLQGIETVPGLLAAIMFGAVSKANGWRDILRFAGQPFAMATQALTVGAEEISYLALNDKATTLRWLDAVMEELKDVRRWVYQNDADTLTAILGDLQSKREKWVSERGKNEWIEAKMPDVEYRGLGEQMFGRLGRKRDKDKD